MSAVCDVTDTRAHAEFCARVKKDWGNIGILVNNAGISPKQPDGASARIVDVSLDEWSRVLDVNLGSVLRLCQLVVPYMREQGWGRIINISSLAGRTISRVAGVSYSASKAGLLSLTRNLANELGPLGVTANAIAPGRVATSMAMQGGEEINKQYSDLIPVGRLGRPEEVAAVVAFLASENTGFINGATIDINGGYFMG
jgi:3-oxoacyl-[acyl-carrier protein] reductase